MAATTNTDTKPRKILVLGSGGREHALGIRLLACASVREVVVTPGNAGTTSSRVPGKTLRSVSGDALEIAQRELPDLVVIGPEVPLCEGLGDRLTAAGHLVFGPSQRAAQLEGSKAFMKRFAARHGLPTARFHIVSDVPSAERAIADFAEPPVVKADGLCAGKGVVVSESHEEALSVARRMLSGEAFGTAGQTLVIEERTPGSEASMHAICDGERFVILPAAQDHKRIFDGDRGPNTGGMGAYAPAPLVTPELKQRIAEQIFERAVRGMAADGQPFRGALYAGLMITPKGEPSLIEFNVRFGDPETQVLMAVLDGDFAAALSGAARGALDPELLEVSSDHALCVVLAAAGYPEAPRSGDVIRGLARAAEVPGISILHAGTKLRGEDVVTSGGRVLGVTARAASLAEAQRRAYEAAALIEFDGCQYRKDIGARALGAKV
ncbi:MAG TPA: phosphoribosylamine--glycine ligase [Polyangiaceae bacterium]|jgi:phosphoribosylamine--glycine ligase|nr:phosphoribosylamine--glycine ligase [Polyangiaceae bacterium]